MDNNGDLDGAIAEYREVVRLEPNDQSSHWSLLTLALRKCDWDGVLQEGRETVRLGSKDTSWLFFGRVLKGAPDAIAQLRQAIRLNPQDGHSHADLGIALSVTGDLDDALAELRLSTRLDPTNFWAHYYAGDVLEKKGNKTAALREYRIAYNQKPTNFVCVNAAYERLKGELGK